MASFSGSAKRQVRNILSETGIEATSNKDGTILTKRIYSPSLQNASTGYALYYDPSSDEVTYGTYGNTYINTIGDNSTNYDYPVTFERNNTLYTSNFAFIGGPYLTFNPAAARLSTNKISVVEINGRSVAFPCTQQIRTSDTTFSVTNTTNATIVPTSISVDANATYEATVSLYVSFDITAVAFRPRFSISTTASMTGSWDFFSLASTAARYTPGSDIDPAGGARSSFYSDFTTATTNTFNDIAFYDSASNSTSVKFFLLKLNLRFVTTTSGTLNIALSTNSTSALTGSILKNTRIHLQRV